MLDNNYERLHKKLYTKDRRRIRPKLIEKYGMICYWCQVELSTETLTIDHLIPLSKGGSNKMFNLRLSCYNCNQKKSNYSPEEVKHYYAEF